MAIHTEYRTAFFEAGLPIHGKKVLGLHAGGFYFFIHQDDSLSYFLSAGFNDGFRLSDWSSGIEARTGRADVVPDHCFLLPDDFIPIPLELLNSDSPENLFRACQVLPDSHQVVVSPVAGSEVVLLSAVRKSTYNYLSQLCNENPPTDLAAIWLSRVLSRKSDGVFAWVFPGNVIVAIIRNQTLQLMNQFDYQGKSDFLYFLLGAVKSVGLSPSASTIHLSGEISPASVLSDGLESYFHEVGYLAANFTADQEQKFIAPILYPLV